MKKVVIIGASGFGGEMAWVMQRVADSGVALEIVGFCDDAPAKHSALHSGLTLLGTIEAAAEHLPTETYFHVAVGNNRSRQYLTNRAVAIGWLPYTVIDPTAIIAPSASLGKGCYIGANTVISSCATVGDGVIINLNATVGHDTVIGDFAHICPGARVSGLCRIGDHALLGSNSVVIPGVSIGNGATLGTTAAATRNLPDNTTLARLNG